VRAGVLNANLVGGHLAGLGSVDLSGVRKRPRSFIARQRSPSISSRPAP
jgi:hypothetical protein